MKIWFPLVAAVLLTACSDAPVVKKAPEKPPEPLTGREGFYKTYPQARTWATDAQPMRVRSIELNELKADPAKAAAWEVTYTSEVKGRSKVLHLVRGGGGGYSIKACSAPRKNRGVRAERRSRSPSRL